MNTLKPQLFKRGLSSKMSADRINQTMLLPDGRTLGFAEYGSSSGRPVLYFHGFPSSRIEAKPIEKYASKHNIRVLSLDRPGYGLSTPQPNRTLLDWPADVAAFAKAMDIPKFDIMGTSGGGPFAVACAHSLPPNMLAGVGLFASGPPWAAGSHYMTRTRRVCCFLANKVPTLWKWILDATLAVSRWIAARGFVTRRVDAWLENINAAKNDPEARPVVQQREYLVDLIIGEPFRQGTGAMALETKLLSDRDWGFRLEDVTTKVKIWHGTKDRNAPIEAIRYLTEKMPNAELTEFGEDTHYTMGTKIEQALEELMTGNARS